MRRLLTRSTETTRSASANAASVASRSPSSAVRATLSGADSKTVGSSAPAAGQQREVLPPRDVAPDERAVSGVGRRVVAGVRFEPLRVGDVALGLGHQAITSPASTSSPPAALRSARVTARRVYFGSNCTL